MKKIFMFLAIALTFNFSLWDPFGTTFLISNCFSQEKGLVAYWSFDEGSGKIAKDAAGKNNGDIIDAEWTAGKVGKALKFSGEGSFIDIPVSDSLNIDGSVTVELWVKHEGDEYKEWECILAKGDHAYRLHIRPGTFEFNFGVNTGGEFHDQVSGIKPEPGKWYHVAGTYDGAKTCVYVNGKLAASGAEWSGPIDTNDLDLYIGDNSEATGRFFKGIIDEVRIYSRALSEAEIKTRYDKEK